MLTYEDEKKIREIIKEELGRLGFKSDRILIADGKNLQVGAINGTQIAINATEKLGFYGATPVVQQTAVTAPTDAGAGYNQVVAQSCVDAVKAILTRLKNLGFFAT